MILMGRLGMTMRIMRKLGVTRRVWRQEQIKRRRMSRLWMIMRWPGRRPGMTDRGVRRLAMARRRVLRLINLQAMIQRKITV